MDYRFIYIPIYNCNAKDPTKHFPPRYFETLADELKILSYEIIRIIIIRIIRIIIKLYCKTF